MLTSGLPGLTPDSTLRCDINLFFVKLRPVTTAGTEVLSAPLLTAALIPNRDWDPELSKRFADRVL